MATKVDYGVLFQKEFRRLIKSFPKVVDELDTLTQQLESDERPGDKVPNVGEGYDVYKVRLKNPSAKKGKSGGFRVIYYVQLVDLVLLVSIYSKTQQVDISPEDIRALIDDLPLDSNDEDEE